MHTISCGFFNGSFANPFDDLIMGYEWAREVHAEIWFDNMRITSCGLHEHSVICFPKREGDLSPGKWHSIRIPVTDPGKALSFLERSSESRAQYMIPMADFVLPNKAVDYLDKDDDCDDPMSWKHLFCSKFALLFLRHCHRQKIIDAPEERLKLLWSVNSNKCSPALLKQILVKIFASK